MGRAVDLSNLGTIIGGRREAPVPLVVKAVEEAAATEGVAPKAVWHNRAKLARSLAVHRQGLRA